MSRRAWAGAVLAAGLLVAWLAWPAPRRAVDPVREPASAVPATQARGQAALGARAASRASEREEVARRSPDIVEVREERLIASVRIEPSDPCLGDTLRVTTELLPDAADAKVFVDGQAGNPAVVRVEEAGQALRVLARGWDDRFERRHLRVDARECDDGRLRPALRVTRVGERYYAFRLVPAPEEEVRWDFGDGIATRGHAVTHRYASRADRTHSTYLVEATLHGPDGPESAFASVTHVEPVGMAARTAYPTLDSEGPRFVDWDEGLVTSRHITNALPVDVELAHVELRGFPCDGSRAEVREGPAATWLSRTRVAAGETAETELRLPADTFEAPVCELLVQAAGPAEDGRLALSTFALDTGIPDERHPIEDPELLAALAALSEARGDRDDPITPEELAAFRATTGY